MTELRCKGLMLRNRLALLEERCDVAGELHPRLSRALREALGYGRVVAGGWYPIAWLREIHAAAAEVIDERDLAWNLGAEGARRNFTTVHRAFMTVLSPGAVLKRAPRVFGSYFDGGRYDVERSDDGEAAIAISECHGFDRATWDAIAGTAHAVLEMCRCRDVRTDVTVERGLSRGRLHATWR